MIRKREPRTHSFTAARSIWLTALFLIGLSTAGYAQTGKITAKIIDAKTKEPLVGAIIKILETRQGARAKDDGVATIINVAPSESYTVVAKYAGMDSMVIKGVRVQSDITTALNFRLGSKEKEIIVTGNAPLVEKTKTDLSTKFASSTLANMPGRQRLDEIIKLTPGLVQDNANGGFAVHGSRGTSNSIRFNNVEVSDVVSGKSSTLQNAVSRLAISEVNVTTAGGGADKGGYTGAEVNTQTKQGGSTFDLTAHMRMEVPGLFGKSGNGLKQMAAGDRIYELGVGGPLFTDDVKYFITAKVNSFDFYNSFSDPTFSNRGLGLLDPAGNNLGQVPNSDRIRRSATGKLSFNLAGFSTTADVLLSSESDHLNSAGLLYLDPYYVPGENDVNNVYSLTARGQVGDAGILEMTGSFETYDKQYGKFDHSQKMDIFHGLKFQSYADNYTYNDQDHSIIAVPDGIIDAYTPVTRQIPNPANPTQPYGSSLPGINPFTGHVEGPAITSTNTAYGLANQYDVIGNVAGFSVYNNKQIQIDAKYNQQIGSHLMNVGFEGHFFSIYNYSNDLPWDANPFKDSYYVHPYNASVYAEDKMEFSDITFQPGIRLDIYQPDASRITDLYNPLGSTLSKTPLQSQISPRLGITYAVTDVTTFNFNYGWYFKPPLLGNVLTNTAGGSVDALRRVLARGNQTIGNAGLNAERTKEITVGFSSQLSDLFAVSVQGVYKDLRDQAGLQRITSPLLPVGYTIYSDDQYGNSRSLELILEKRMADNYSVKFNYTYSVSKGTSSSATENYSQLINSDPNAEASVLPLTPFYFSYDRPHVAQLLLNVNFNKGEGPTLFGSKLLQLFSLATTSEYQSGTPYTAADSRGHQVGDFNGNREPDYFQTDATLTRSIPFEDIFGSSLSSMFLDLQLEVTNLFNRTEALYVYPTSGQGDNDGLNSHYLGTTDFYNDPTNTRGGSLDALGNLIYNPRLDLNHDNKVSVHEFQIAYERSRADGFARRLEYQIPRRVYMNFTLRF